MTNIEEELKKAQEILDNNPVLEYSPGDLRRMGKTVEDYLSRWPQADQEKYRDYYEEELCDQHGGVTYRGEGVIRIIGGRKLR